MINSILTYIKKGGFLFIFLAYIILINHRTGYISLVTIFSIFVFLGISICSKLDKYAILIIIFEFLYFTISSINGITYDISSIIIYHIAPLFFYQYGYYFSNKYKTDNYIIIAWVIIIVCYCFDIFSITLENISANGELLAQHRSLTFVEDGGYSLTATLVGLPMDIAIVGLPMAIITSNKTLRFTFLALFFFSLLTTLHLLNRTALIIAIISILIIIGYKSRKNPKVFIISIIVIIFLIAILTYFGIISDNLVSLYTERNEDLSTAGNRTGRWADAITNLFTSPFGWTEGASFYVHNMWLDIARLSGIIPFLILVYLTFNTFWNSYKLLKNYERDIAYLMFGLNICFFASCFVEPIYGGTHLNLYFMLMGTLNYLIKREDIDKKYTHSITQ